MWSWNRGEAFELRDWVMRVDVPRGGDSGLCGCRVDAVLITVSFFTVDEQRSRTGAWWVIVRVIGGVDAVSAELGVMHWK